MTAVVEPDLVAWRIARDRGDPAGAARERHDEELGSVADPRRSVEDAEHSLPPARSHLRGAEGLVVGLRIGLAPGDIDVR
jgi:hypothetical protein